MHKKIVIMLSLIAAVVTLLMIWIAPVAFNPPPFRMGAVLNHPFSDFKEKVEARPDNSFTDSYCLIATNFQACEFGTDLNFPGLPHPIVARIFDYRIDTNGIVTSVTSGWKWYYPDDHGYRRLRKP